MIKNRKCDNCNSITTSLNVEGYECWYKIKETPNKFWCKLCYMKKIGNPKFIKENNHKRILFKNKRIYLDIAPRIGVCNLCRSVEPFDCKQTNIHHEKYDDNNPLKYTLEICPKCHQHITVGYIK